MADDLSSMLTTVQPLAVAVSRPLSSLPMCDSRSQATSRSASVRWMIMPSLSLIQAKRLTGVMPSIPVKSFPFSVRMSGMLSRIISAASCRSK